MNAHSNETRQDTSKAVANSRGGTNKAGGSVSAPAVEYIHGPERREPVGSITNSPVIQQLKAMQAIAGNGSNAKQLRAVKPVGDDRAGQEKETSLPGKSEGASVNVAQRLLVPFKTPAMPNADEVNIAVDAAAIEGLTAVAYANTWNRLTAAAAIVPVPLDIAQFPGVSARRFAHMANMLQGNDDALKAAAVGYVIEDQVSNGGIPGTVASQVGVGGAIPDFVSTRGINRGIIDVTSSGQQGHVLNKNFDPGPFSYIGEATYQSLNFGALNGVAPVLGGAAAALAQQARQRRANEYIGRMLYTLLRQAELIREGVGYGMPDVTAAVNALKGGVNALPNAVLTNGEVAAIDQLVADLNALLHPDHHQQTLTNIIAAAQAKYLVAGNPLWP